VARDQAAVQLGKRLKRLRTSQGLTQKQLAEPRYTHAYVSTIEAGRRRPSREALQHFAKRLSVDTDELATGRPPDLAARLTLRVHDARLELSRGRDYEARNALEAIVKEARRFKLPSVESQAHATIALCDEQAGDIEAAIGEYEVAEELLREEPLNARAYAIAGQARCHHMLGDARYAIHLLESFIESMDREGLRDPEALVRSYAPLVLAYFDAGLFEQANATATEALRLARDVSDPANLATMHVNVARVLLHDGKYVQADRSLRRAEDLYRQVDYPTETGVAHLARGYVLTRKGELDRAEPELSAARRILHATGSKINEARALNELGRVARLQGRIPEAESLLNQALKLLKGDRDVSSLAWAHRELGICRAPGDPETAEKNYRRAIGLYERSGEALQLASTYRHLGDLLNEQGRSDAGCEAYRTGILKLEADL
jgi:tetratricopeptide (TPR) repeat protein